MSQTSSPLQLQVVVSPAVDLTIGGTFSPTTATIITGQTEAVLVDTLYTHADVDRLAEAIEATGKKLTTIYITHAHFDHYIGLGPLLERFPDARGVATAPVAQLIHDTFATDKAITDVWMPGAVIENLRQPGVLEGDVITLDGHELRIVDVGQADIGDSTILHIPDLDAVVAGDVIYNGVHQMLGLTGPDQWKQWIESVDKVESLAPRLIVAGHRGPGRLDTDVDGMLNGTRDYISTFMAESAEAPDAETLVARMTQRFPDRVNLATLLFSAGVIIEQRNQARAASSAH